jgi:uncharacterized protein YjbJ (UPF0337 family)
MSNTADKISGKTEQVFGEVTNQKDHEIKGKLKVAKADAKEKLHDAKKKIT